MTDRPFLARSLDPFALPDGFARDHPDHPVVRWQADVDAGRIGAPREMTPAPAIIVPGEDA